MLKSIDGGKTFSASRAPSRRPSRLLDRPEKPAPHDRLQRRRRRYHHQRRQNLVCAAAADRQFYHVACDNSVPYRVMGCMQDKAPRPARAIRFGEPASSWATGTPSAAARPASPSPIRPIRTSSMPANTAASSPATITAPARPGTSASIPSTTSGHGAEELKYRFQWTAPILVSPHDPRITLPRGQRPVPSPRRRPNVGQDQPRPDAQRQNQTEMVRRPDHRRQHRRRDLLHHLRPRRIAEGAKVLWAGSDDGLVHVTRDGGDRWENVTTNIPELPEWAPSAASSRRRSTPARPISSSTPIAWTTSAVPLEDDRFRQNLEEDRARAAGRRLLPRRPRRPQTQGLALSRHRTRRAVLARRRRNLAAAQAEPADRRRHDLVVKDNDLVVGTKGRSIWIFDDLTPIREWTPCRRRQSESSVCDSTGRPMALSWSQVSSAPGKRGRATIRRTEPIIRLLFEGRSRKSRSPSRC